MDVCWFPTISQVKIWFIIQLKEPRKDMFSISFRFFQKLPKNTSRSFGFYSTTETGCGSSKKNSEIQWGNKNEGNSKTRAVTYGIWKVDGTVPTYRFIFGPFTSTYLLVSASNLFWPEHWQVVVVWKHGRIIRINRFQIQRNEDSLFCQVNNLIDNGLQFRWFAKCQVLWMKRSYSYCLNLNIIRFIRFVR